tara:strand:- start:2476 stop:3459 length:984 start_codon:yes stop_codon:yes gene_type:complete
MIKKVGIIGAGSWGIALGINIISNNYDVAIWGNNSGKIKKLNENRKDSKLENILIDERINFTDDLSSMLKSDLLIYACPAQVFGLICEQISSIDKVSTPIVIAAKGIDCSKQLLLDKICKINLPNAAPIILSGPGFALDIAQGLPTALTLACKNLKKLEEIGPVFANNSLRPYYNDDLIGVQIGGALKNVIAIATGIAMGKKLGDGAVASLISRGINEIIAFGIANGAKKETFLGLSGIGDLILTATSLKSRNTKLGYEIGANESYKDLGNLTEGVHTVKAVHEMSKKLGINLPVIDAVYNLLNNGYKVDDMINSLINRPLKSENIY